MDGGEVEDALSRILSDLESLPPEDPLPDSSLRDLLSLLASPSSPALCSSPFGEDDAFPLWPRLSSSGLSLSTLLRPLSAAMDLAFPRSSLLASRVYLSLLLTHSAPVLSIFSPLAFLSLLGSLRRAIKPLPSPPQADRRRKRKLGRLVPPDDQMEDQEHDAAANEDQILIILGLLDSALSRIRLDSSPDGFKSLVDTVAAVLSSSFVDHHRFSSVCFQIFYSLICRPEHGDHTTVTAEVLKSLATLILSSPPKSPLRVGTLGFVIRKIVPLSKEHVEIRKALVYFPRYLASKAPERADPRAAAVDAMLEVVRVFQKEDQVGFAEYVIKMTQGKSQLRLLSVDLILGLLTSLPDPLGVDETVEPAKCWGMKSLKALLQRCSDSMGGIRARALTNIAQVIEFLLKSARSSARLQQGIEFGNAEFNELVRKRCLDEKAAVRKAALLLITKSTALIGGQIDEVVLRTIGSACLDPLVSIRKAAVSALSEVYRQFPDERVITEWLHSVPCLIVDNETSIQEDSENFFLELILDQISIASDVSISDSAKDLESVIPDRVLVLLKGLCNMEVLPSVGKICNSLGKKKKLKASVVTSLQNIISISESLWLRKDLPIERWIAPVGAWKLLSEVSLFTPKAVDWRFLHHHWNLLDKAMTLGKDRELDRTEPNSVTWVGDRVSLLQTISNVSLMLTPVAASELAADLLRRIDEFNMHLCEVDAHAKALRTLCKQKAVSPEEGNDLIAKWVHQLLSGALGIVESYMSRVSETVNTDCFVTPSGTREGNNEEASCKLLRQAITAIFTIGSLALIYPSAELHHIAALLHTIITSGKPGAKATKLKGLSISMKEIAPSLYIQAWVTMGKICLVDDKLAKRYIPLFVQELESSKCAALRNNILVVMVDFCVRYTALVDCYIPKITTMLHDPCEVVRRQTFILLSRLLQRDYVKWRGVLFLNFLLSLVDDSEKIRNLAEYLFGNILKVKAPLLAYNSFVEAIFFLNGCVSQSGQSEAPETRSRLFKLSGNVEKVRAQRMHIYVSLLKQMAPEHLLATSAKLCVEILAAASDGLLSIDDAAGQSVVQDALQILSCKEIRIHSSKSSEAAAELEDDGGDSGGSGSGSASIVSAKRRVVTQVAKKNLVQNAIPIYIELKRILESKNSPLIGSLMECLRVLLKDYKNEMDEILVADKQLQKELLYDMHKYEACKTKHTVAEAVAYAKRDAARGSPTAAAAASAGKIFSRVSEKLGSGGNIGSAIADAAARVTVRSVLREANRSSGSTPLRSMSIPKVKGSGGRVAGSQRAQVIESLRRRQTYESDDED